MRNMFETLDFVYFGVRGCLDDNRNPEPSSSSFRFSKNEVSVYGKH